MGSPLAAFLTPHGFAPPPAAAVLREASLLPESARYLARHLGERHARRATPYVDRVPLRGGDPVVLVPGFLAGDASLAMMARSLRQLGYRTYRSQIRANIGCTLDAAAQLERRLDQVAQRRESKVQIVGHSLGGMLARGLAARRPDLVSGIVTMGSPSLAPGAHHISLSASVDVLVRLSRAGVRGVMAAECVAGACARQSFEDGRLALAPHIGFTSIYSRRDGIVDWRACVDPLAHPVEVTASHIGMAVDPRVRDAVVQALGRHAAHAAQLGHSPLGSVVEVDRRVGA